MANKEKQVNRKQIVGLAREKLFSRGLTIGTGVIVALVIGLVGWGLIQERIIKPRTIVAIVEGKEINGADFASRVRVNRQQLIASYLQNFQDYQIFGGNAEIQQQVLSRMSLTQFQLEPSQVGFTTINQLIDDEIISLEAQKIGISVSNQEVEREMQSFFNYFPDGTPTAEIAATLDATSTLSNEQYAIISVTPTSATIPTSEFLSADPTGTTSPTNDPNAIPTSTVTPVPSPTPFTEDAYNAVFIEYLDIQLKELGLSEDALYDLVKINLIRDQLFNLLTDDMVAKEEQVWARHILVEDELSAIVLLDLLANGTDWAELAHELSQDTSNAEQGGDLGWFVFDAMVEPFAQAAFDLAIGEISAPVESAFGWHVIQILGHENRPLEQEAFARARNDVFQDFLSDLRSQYEWEIIGENWFSITPDEPDIPSQFKLTQ